MNIDKLRIISVKKSEQASARQTLETLDCICSQSKDVFFLLRLSMSWKLIVMKKRKTFSHIDIVLEIFLRAFSREKLMRTRYWIRLLIWNVLFIHIASFLLPRAPFYSNFLFKDFCAAAVVAYGESIKKLSHFFVLWATTGPKFKTSAVNVRGS